jgi:anti-sigma regulatory factor (Ser/Thr protein kinase)
VALGDRADGGADEADPQPLLLELTGEPLPPLVQVRAWAATALADLDDEDLHAVQLAATELLANAYDHGRGPIRVRLARSRVPCTVCVEVDDGSPEPPTLGRSRLGQDRGRGLIIVAKLATDWGTRRLPEGGKTVWALIPCG